MLKENNRICFALKGRCFISVVLSSFQTGLTALHVAAQYGQTDLVREMLTIVPATLKSDTPAGGESGVKDLPSEVIILKAAFKTVLTMFKSTFLLQIVSENCKQQLYSSKQSRQSEIKNIPELFYRSLSEVRS